MCCKGKIAIFREKFGLKLENGVPTDDTFQRIFAIIKHEQLEKCFWCLDMNFDEDRCHTKVDNRGENLAVIRHIFLMMIFFVKLIDTRSRRTGFFVVCR